MSAPMFLDDGAFNPFSEPVPHVEALARQFRVLAFRGGSDDE